ncbi:zinc transporter 10 isoform X1 [Pangasianodon hypophthalmus]|uniref:zinc transporter 10 isoform X1 n=1 Tax=Pangasianodon hypophthalmus TaxID=310915 RepID=UPI0023082850|nr:zinc transporter 10 isoform X1 [Pangasianodon hypophthalmus]
MGRYSGKSCRLGFMLTMTSMFFLAEIVGGYVGNSIALVSDSFNMLSDIISLSVGLVAARVRRRSSSPRCTYGLVRVEVLGALANAVFLAAVRFSVSAQALERLAQPEAIDKPELVLVVGSIGLCINVVGLLVFQDWRCLRRKSARTTQRDSEPKSETDTEAGFQRTDLDEVDEFEDEGHHLNIRGVLLHMLNDALGSVVVVVTSALFYVWPKAPDVPCNWQCYVDPSMTLVMVAIIMPSAIPLARETASILLQIIPHNMPFNRILQDVCSLPGVLSVHDAHLWELTKGRYVSSLHVRVSTELHSSLSGIKMLHQQIRDLLHHVGIHSVTVQLEFGDGSLERSACSTPCSSPSCLKVSCCPHDVAGLPLCKANQLPHPREFPVNMYETSSVPKIQALSPSTHSYTATKF